MKIDLDRTVGPLDRRILGQFVEHYGSVIYGGLVGASDGSVDRGVQAALRELAVPVLRWPGGNFASGYHWEDGVGDTASRPTRFDLEWRVDEPNAFGTDEFLQYCESLGIAPYICVNAGSGSAEEAAHWVDYCNRNAETGYPALRAKNGRRAPYGVRYWGIGNEVYGRGQIGRKDVDEYIGCVKEYSRLMKKVDPSIELIAVGWERAEWNFRLVKEAGEYFDYLALHSYHPTPEQFGQAMALPTVVAEQMREMIGAIDAASYYLKERRGHPIKVAMDEWNMREWDHMRFIEWLSLAYRFNRHNRELEAKSSMLRLSDRELGPEMLGGFSSSQVAADHDDGNVSLTDALYNASVIHLMMRSAGRVTLGGYSPMLNGKGVLSRAGNTLVLRPTYHVFALYGRLTGGTVLDVWTQSEGYETYVASEAQNFRRDVRVPYLDAAAVADGTMLRLFVVNRHSSDSLGCEIAIDGFTPRRVTRHVLSGDAPDATNTAADPERVRVARSEAAAIVPLRETFAPHSVTLLELEE